MPDSDALPDGLPTLSDGGRRYDRAKLLAAVESKLFERAPSSVSLGRYVLRESIGKGGFGIVYRAEDPLLRREVAIKLLRSRRTDDELSGPEALVREARMAALIEHPNVVRVYDVGRVDTPGSTDDVFVVMELLSGQPFHRWKRAHAPTTKRVVALMLDVCEGLAAAHARKVVHCDVKPANVFVMDDGSAKVVDFGLALHASQRMSSLSSTGSPDEQSDFVAGTPPYMAPEAHQGAPLEPFSDQYSFGLLLAEAIAGAYPFGRGSPEVWFRAKQRGLDPTWLREHVPRGLHEILRRATEPRPHRRFPSMHALSDALRRWLNPPSVLPWIAGALVVTVGAAAVWGSQRDSTCVVSASSAVQIWDDAREPLRARWTDDWGAQAREQFEERLDAFATEWATAAEQACEIRGAPQCLRDQVGQLRAVLDTVSETSRTRQHANLLAAKLGAPADCLDPDGHSPPLPQDPSSWPEVETVREAIARAGLASIAGEYDSGVKLAKDALVEANTLGFAPLEAEAMAQVGLSLSAASEFEGARDYLEQAYFAAEGLRHETLAARVATRLIMLHGDRLRDDERARAWARRARASLERLPDEEPVHARFAFNLGKVETRAGHMDLARTSLEEAERRFGDLGLAFDRGRAMVALGELELAAGNAEQALARFQAVHAQRKETLGANHPNTAFAHGFVARGLLAVGDHDGARKQYLEALGVLGASVGTSHAAAASMLGNVGAIEVRLGFFEQGLDHTQRALDQFRETLPAGHLAFAVAYDNLAEIHLELGNAQEAHALDVQALDIRVQRLPPDHPHIIRAHAKIAWGLAQLGRVDEAEVALEEAEAAMKRVDLRDPGMNLLVAFAWIELGRRPVKELRALIDELAEGDVGPFVARFELAKLLAETDPQEARTLAREASRGFEALGAEPRQAAVDAWLREL